MMTSHKMSFINGIFEVFCNNNVATYTWIGIYVTLWTCMSLYDQILKLVCTVFILVEWIYS